MVGLPVLVSLMNCVRYAGLRDVVVLPNVAFRVQDCHFPVELAVSVVLDVDDLPAGARVHARPVLSEHINAVMEVGRAAVILVGLNHMPHLHNRKRPGVN